LRNCAKKKEKENKFAQLALRKRKLCAKVQPLINRKAHMKISKRTEPSLQGGLFNKNFVYVRAENTNVAATFAKVLAAADATAKVLDGLADALFSANSGRGLVGGPTP
jgi:hypothetical protein